jgi:Na+/H+ antiporter NhaC
MDVSFLAITPPLLVIVLVVLTRHMILSFMGGILLAGILARHGNIFDTATLIGKRFLASAGLSTITSWHGIIDNQNLAIFIFLCSLGAIISLLQFTGAANAYGYFIRRFVHTRQGVEIASLVLSCFFFIDDYFSALTVGSVMRPLATAYKVAPLKLAFLVTALASPIAIITPISSWVGEIVLQLKQSGVGPAAMGSIVQADPFYIFLNTIPFIFYALLLIFAAWYIVLRRISYGPMAVYEASAQSNSVVIEVQDISSSSLLDFILPLLVLVSTVFTLLLYTGGYSGFGGQENVFVALKKGVPHQALLVGGLVGVVFTSIYFLLRQKLTIPTLIQCLKQGSFIMIPSIIMLIHAWTLGSILKLDLHTGDYVAQWFGLCVCIPVFPAVCFVATAIISSLIGSAWAAIGLMFPIVIPMLQALIHSSAFYGDIVPLLLPIIGATLSGSIMGTHLSLLADNPMMSSASTGANHLEHIKTMTWYVIPVGIASVTAYLLLGYTQWALGIYKALLLALSMSIISLVLLFELGQYFFGKKPY